MTREELIVKYLQKWARKLQLTKFIYTITTGKDSGFYAKCDWDNRTKSAGILIMETTKDEEIEETVLHELLHIYYNTGSNTKQSKKYSIEIIIEKTIDILLGRKKNDSQ